MKLLLALAAVLVYFAIAHALSTEYHKALGTNSGKIDVHFAVVRELAK
jgi:hypothetical protein